MAQSEACQYAKSIPYWLAKLPFLEPNFGLASTGAQARFARVNGQMR